MNNTLKAQYSINSFDINPIGNARLTAIANYLQETAYKHATELELGYHHLEKQNRAWVLSRLKISVEKFPAWDDVVTVETWPRGIEKLFALRDFRITGPGGEQLVTASTCWLMVDTNTHRPVRIPGDFIKIETRDDSVFDRTPGKMNFSEQMEQSSVQEVKYSDLDIVGHVNNVKYIEWCLDSLDPAIMDPGAITGIGINFISEAKQGEAVEIHLSEHENGHFCLKGINRATGKNCFEAELQT